MVKEFIHRVSLDPIPMGAPIRAVYISVREKSVTIRVHSGRQRQQLICWSRYSNK